MPRLTDSTMQKFSALIQLMDRRLMRNFYFKSDYGLSPLQINVLLLLANDTPSMGEIADTLDISKPNVTPIVDKLIRMGLAERIPDSKDCRRVNVHATEAGKKKIREIRTAMRKEFELRFRTCDESKLADFLKAISTCVDFLEDMDRPVQE